MENVINGTDFKMMVKNAAVYITNNRKKINELNVFPVPDGDTGTNMSLTIAAAVEELERFNEDKLSRAAEVVAGAMLRGARGNSGVIMSLLFRGISRSLKDHDTATPVQLAEALSGGVDAAYKAVMKPAEGTILTVSRVSSAAAKAEAEKTGDMEKTLSVAYAAAAVALEETPSQNPVLAKAGVVDAGGVGYMYILQGFLEALKGHMANASETEESEGGHVFDVFDTGDITFAYCTEFIITVQAEDADPLRLRAFLEAQGDSVVVVDDESIIKVHVHTNDPGLVLQEAMKYGPLIKIKIDNMHEQHNEQVITESEKNRKAAPAAPEKKYGFVAVAAGKGIAAVFRDLGTDWIIEGGQTMNPSTEDILSAVNRTPAEIVFVLPNNKNIILAAEQTVGLSEKTVIVIPTKTIPQGIAALLAFDPDAESEENTGAMQSAMRNVRTGLVTYAARDSVFDGQEIRQGDYIGMAESRLDNTGPDLTEVITKLSGALDVRSAQFITIFYGENVSAEEAEKISGLIGAESGGKAEINLLEGGQPVYYYILSVE